MDHVELEKVVAVDTGVPASALSRKGISSRARLFVGTGIDIPVPSRAAGFWVRNMMVGYMKYIRVGLIYILSVLNRERI